jgi:hypothetical protein
MIAAVSLLGGHAQAQTNLVSLVSDGAWTWFNDPRAVFHNGALYFGCVRSDGASTLNVLDLQSGATRTLWTSTWSQFDDHDNAGLLPLQDGRLLALYARHGSANTFSYRFSLTSTPTTPGLWGAEQTSPNTGAGLTYCNPYQLVGESGKVYDFCRDLNFNPTVLTSADNGNTWSAPSLFIKTGTGGTRPYVKYCSDYNGRVEVLYTDGHPRDVANSLYHTYYLGGNLYQTDGTFLKSFAAIPLLHDSGERGTVIYQYSDAETADFNDHIPTGRAWCWEIVYQTNGWPACVFSVQRDFVTGPGWTDDRIYYYYARWTGTNWQKRFIAQAGRPLYESEDDYAGGIALDPDNANVVYLSSDAANPFDVTTITNVPLASHFELYKGVTTDGGLSFSWTAVTTNSTVDNLRPYVPRKRQGIPALLWFRGNYVSYTSFTTALVGLFTNTFPRAALMAYWPLDTGGGGTTPELALGNNLTLYGNPNIVTGVISNAFSFDGISQYLSTTHDPNGTNGLPLYQPGRPITIAMWVRGSAQTGKYLLAEGSITNTLPLFLLQTGQNAGLSNRLDVLIRTTSGTTLVNHYVSTRPVFDGTWHHVAYADSGGSVQLYVDGAADTNFSYSAAGSLALNTTTLGALVRTNASGFFNGSMDDVIVWGRALTQAEVQAAMSNSIPVPPPTPPSIVQQSTSSTNGVGETLSLSVQAIGTAPLKYQWSKNSQPISPATNPGATNATLALTNIQLVDSGAYRVVITNGVGAVTSSIINLSVITVNPITNGVALALDFDLTGSPNTFPGFQAFSLGANGATYSNSVQVTLSPIGGITLAERLRSAAPLVSNNPPALTQAQLYNDFDFANSTADANGLSILISRLAPNTKYGVTIWSFDPQSPGNRVSDWTETASGISVPIVTGYSFNGSVLPTADYDYTFGALLTSSPSGQLQIQGVRHGGTSFGVFVNALRLVANPVLRITSLQTTVGGNLQLVVQSQYPGQPVTFEEASDVVPPGWLPSTNAVFIQARGTTVTAEFPLSPGRKFYRASGH